MKQLKAIGSKVFQVYFSIGVLAMGLLAVSVFVAVILRYFFSLSWKELSEFNVTLFAFTTFWGLGVNVIRGEHVVIDMLVAKLPLPAKKVFSIIDYVILLAVDLIFVRQSWIYTLKMGKQISQGMEIPMRYMYGIMPVCGTICAVCIVIKLIEFIVTPVSAFGKQDTDLNTMTQ